MSRAGESIRARLGDLAKARGVSTEFILVRWIVERFLYRLAQSPHADWLMLKGGHLFTVWEGDLHRPTTDLDLHSLDIQEAWRMQDVLASIAMQAVEYDDGVSFEADRIGARVLSGGATPSLAVHIRANVGSAKLPLKVKVAFGGVVTPGSEQRWMSSLLPGAPGAQIRCYSRETVIAEKLAIGVEYGPDNTRLWDYVDIWHLTNRYTFLSHVMLDTIRGTFATRAAHELLHRREEYWAAAFRADLPTRRSRRECDEWIKEHAPRERCGSFAEIIQGVAEFAVPLLRAVRDERNIAARWVPGGGWIPETGRPLNAPSNREPGR